MAWRANTANANGVAQPEIDISSYATPVAANDKLVAVAVLYLMPDEADAVKEFARGVKNRRGDKGARSVTVTWGTRVEGAALRAATWDLGRYNEDLTTAGLIVRSGRELPGWEVYRMPMNSGWSLQSPDGDMYKVSEDTRTVERASFRCANGHTLPTETSWCKICEKREDTWNAKVRVQKSEPQKPVQPEPPRDRFSGLEF